MPKELEDCVKKLLAKWKEKPVSQPKLKEGQDLKSAAYGICQSTSKMEEDQEILLEGVGPALVAAAVTAKPHLRQRGHEIKIVERDGQKLVQVPLFRQGIYRHPKGKLVLNQKFFNRIIENHEKKVTDYPVHLDFRHTDSMGALAFLDAADGGFLEVNEGWLTAYGPPVDEKAEEVINSRKWRYASAEFAPDYESNLVQKLSTEHLSEMSQNDILDGYQANMEVTMPEELTFGDVKVTLEEAEDGESFVLTQDALTSITDVYTAVEKAGGENADKVVKLEEQIVTLEAQVKELAPEPDPEIPEAVRLQLEAHQVELKELRQQRLKERIALALERARAYEDDKGNKHSPVLLEMCEKALALKPIGEGDDVIKLESADQEGAENYLRNFIRILLETIPGQMPGESRTNSDERRLETDEEQSHYTEEEFDEALKELEKF